MRQLRHVPELRAPRPRVPAGGARRRRHAARADRALIATALALAVAACGKHHDDTSDVAPDIALTPAQQQQLDAAIAKSRAALAGADVQWRAAIDEFVPDDAKDHPPCAALDFAKAGLAGNPQGDEWGDWPVTRPLGFNGSSIASFTHAPFPITFVTRGQPTPPHSPEVTAVLARLDRLAGGAESTLPFERRLADAQDVALRTTDVFASLDEAVEPVLDAHRRYTPGSITARVWVFDHAKDRLACLGVVHAASSPTVDPGSSNLDDDLLINFMRALPDGVRARSP